jgi:uncharacterized protein YqhQ
MKKGMIGGQAVLEGVMMKAPKKLAMAVRKEDQTIVTWEQSYVSWKKRAKAYDWPIIRGVVTFLESLVVGIKVLMQSAKMYDEEAAEAYGPSKFDRKVAEKTGSSAENVTIFFSLLLSLALAVGLFTVLPAVITSLLRDLVRSGVLLSLIEGVIRLIIFFGYIIAISLLKDIRRVFQYHGAEHKTINCYEAGKELTVANAQSFGTLNPRCGTAFLLVVMVVSILVFSLLGWENIVLRILCKILLLPLVAGISFEMIRWAGRTESGVAKVLIWPGMMLQKLTTREPDDGQVEVAIRAFALAKDGGIDEEA